MTTPDTSWSQIHSRSPHSGPSVRLLLGCLLAFCLVLAYAVDRHQDCLDRAAGDPERVKACESR